ncbi:hypothetical protein APHAL10511_003086 [Amanita phalloides]|nr:hypothetical protein APHAL10511_003086 [Amanita phalloides]
MCTCSFRTRLGVTKRWVSLLICTLFCPTSLAYDRTTEAGEAGIHDGAVECQPYWYPPVASSLALFPTIWQTASIVSNDSAAWDIFKSLSGAIPNNAIKGTIDGDFSHIFPTYPKNDPDCWWTYGQCTTPKLQSLPPDVFAVPEPRTLGYGFDDGPNCSHNAFYDYLLSNDQQATMFFIGSNVMNWPLEAQRALVDGHEICVHTWSHHYMTGLSNQAAFAELYYTIELVTGVTPTCWRPPFGDVDNRIRAIANGLGLRTVLWSYDSNDWRAGVGNVTAADVDANYERFINEANSGKFDNMGTVMLFHELNNFTMSEATKYHPQLKASFNRIVPIGAASGWASAYTGNIASPIPAGPSQATMGRTAMNNVSPTPGFHMKSGAANLQHPILSTISPILICIVLTI